VVFLIVSSLAPVARGVVAQIPPNWIPWGDVALDDPPSPFA
jgi:hypothetical protein